MSNFDVKCPIGYGLITFIGGGTTRYCPVSGENYCANCKLRPFDNSKEDNRPMKREDAKK